MHVTRTRLGLLLAVIVGAALGAILGGPGNGQAASTVVPKNKTLPTISGSAEIGQTLVTTRGTWSGSPSLFRFAWSRCDTNGAACTAIGGATARRYTVTGSDEFHTLRVTVTAQNASGSASAASAATGVVPPSGCTPGSGVIQIADLAAPARLELSAGSITPAVTRSTHTINLRFQVTACNGRPIQGATVFATAIPYNQFVAAQGTTDANGFIELKEARLGGFPAAARQHLLTIFARASKPGEPALGGVSGSRVVAFHFAR
jgi:hypothetical protein